MPQIRHATRDDIPALCSLLSLLAGQPVSAATAENRLAMVAASPIDELYVIEAEGDVHGLLGFHIRENIESASSWGEISALVTDPACRRLSLGRLLMDYAEDLSRQRGCLGTWLVSGYAHENEAHRFYRELGYESTGYRFVKKPL